MRSYELVFILDPRLTDDEAVEVRDEFKALIESGGARVAREESWGKRKMAYQIQKLREGNYFLFGLEVDEENPIREVEQRMRQSDKVLRFLTVRLDEGRLRIRPPRSKPAAEVAAAPEARAATPVESTGGEVS